MSVIGTIGGVALEQARLRTRLDQLARQVADGQRGSLHGSLGAEAKRGIDLRGEMARRQAHIGAADAALGRMGLAQTVLARIESIAATTAADAQRARTLGPNGVEALATAARAALQEVAALLNTRQGAEHLFAGSDLASAPVPDAAGIADGPMATAIAAAVAGLDPFNAAAVLADTALAVTDPATRPFNAFLEGPALAEPRRALQVADAERVAWGVLANGDWARDLLRGLATLAALTPASAAQGEGYDALLQGVADGLSGAQRGLAQERGALGAAERRVEITRERHKDLLVTLRAQLGALEEVDVAAVSAELRQTEMRLSASYQVTATLARLSLADLLR